MSMNDDDDRELARLLADPSLWLDPDPAVERAVLDAIAAERRSAPASVTPIRQRRRRWSTHVGAGLLGAAAAALVAVIVTQATNSDDDQLADVESSVELRGTDLAPGFVGQAEVITQQSGVAGPAPGARAAPPRRRRVL